MIVKLLSVSLVAILTFGCAFKEDTPQILKKNSSATIFEIVKKSPLEEVEQNISQLSIEQVNTLEENGTTLLEVAADRGHAEIVQLLIDKGASPLRKGSKSDVKPYQKTALYPSEVGSIIGNWTSQFFAKYVLAGATMSSAWQDFESQGGSCTDLLNIHSFFGVFMTYSSPIVQSIAETTCKGKIDLKNFDSWLFAELTLQIRPSNSYKAYINYLLSLKSVEHVEFNLKTNEGMLTINSTDLVRLALLNPVVKNNHEELSRLLDVLPKTRSNIRLSPKADRILLDSYYSVENLTPEDASKLNDKIMFAINFRGLPNFTTCLQSCHELTGEEIR